MRCAEGAGTSGSTAATARLGDAGAASDHIDTFEVVIGSREIAEAAVTSAAQREARASTQHVRRDSEREPSTEHGNAASLFWKEPSLSVNRRARVVYPRMNAFEPR
jgi:hypothetical protein